MDSDDEPATSGSCCCHSGGRFGGVAVRSPASTTPSTGEEDTPERCRGPAGSAGASSFFTVERTTTGGIGRDPGMLIRTRVVSVVSVFGTSSPSGARAGSAGAAGKPFGSPAPFGSPVPYGGVPDG